MYILLSGRRTLDFAEELTYGVRRWQRRTVRVGSEFRSLAEFDLDT